MISLSERKLPRSAYEWNTTLDTRQIKMKKKIDKVVKCSCGMLTKDSNGVCVICTIGINLRAKYKGDIEEVLLELGV